MVGHPDCQPKPGHALGFNNMASAFLIYGGGFFLAVALFILEFLFKDWKKEVNQIQDKIDFKHGYKEEEEEKEGGGGNKLIGRGKSV